MFEYEKYKELDLSNGIEDDGGITWIFEIY